jgi:hypothetical protein
MLIRNQAFRGVVAGFEEILSIGVCEYRVVELHLGYPREPLKKDVLEAGLSSRSLAMVSPSQPRPAVIQRMWSSVSLPLLCESELDVVVCFERPNDLPWPELYPKLLSFRLGLGLVDARDARACVVGKVCREAKKRRFLRNEMARGQPKCGLRNEIG